MNRFGSSWSRASGVGLVAAFFAAAYACSSNNDGGTPPPVNDGGPENDSTTASDGSPTGDGATAGDSSTSGGDSGATNPDGGPAPNCASLPGTKVYIESGDTQEPLLKKLGRDLRDNANITLVFELTGSCTLSPALYDATPIPKNTNMLYIPSASEDPGWTPSDVERTCTTDPSNGTPPDLGISALFPSSCQGIGKAPAGIGSFIGPIQAYTFIVPTAEFSGGQTSISAAEAYYVFGDGANNGIVPAEWTDPTQFFLRPATKSTLVATAYNIGLTAKEMTLANADGGTSDGRHLEATSDEVLSAVEQATGTNAIGILGDEIYDANRGKGANVLAFAAFGQDFAYYPDSTTSSFDKQNIRDGHYTLWSPTVYLTPVDSSNVPTNPAVKYVTDLVLGNQNPTPPSGLVDGGTAIDGLGDVVGVGLTPNCAMQVQRPGDGAPVAPYTPAAPCTCYFLSKIPGGSATPPGCTVCSASNPCEAGTCFNGFCEVPPSPPTTGASGCDIADGSSGSLENACTNSQGVSKSVTLPNLADGGLAPLNP